MRAHDILIRFNNQEVTTPESLTTAVGQLRPNEKISLTYLRGGEKVETTAVLAKRPVSQTETNQPAPMLTDPSTFWMRPFSNWLDTPEGDRVFKEFESKQRDRQNDPVTWSKFQSMSVTKSSGGIYTAKVEYNDNNEKKIRREFTGTRKEIRDEINADKELPEATKEHLLRTLDQQTPDMFRFNCPGSFKDMFDRDWDNFHKRLDF